MMNTNGPRPLGMRKTVQLMVILTILCWATQTLVSQWGYGAAPAGSESARAQTTASFVPATGASKAATATLEIRGEATVIGDAVKLKQICRWNANDNATFAPVADLVVTRLDATAPYRTLTVAQLKELLHDAGVNLSSINFSGAVTCTVDRSDVIVDETLALEKWRAAKAAPGIEPIVQDAPVFQQPMPVRQEPPIAPATGEPVPEPLVASEGPFHTLRDILAEDLAGRLSIDPKSVQIAFNPKDERALNLSEPQFRFQVVPQRAKNLGPVSWEVQIVTDTGIQKVAISGMAKAWQEQIVLSRPISARQIVREQDVVNKRALVDQIDEQPLLTREQVVGNQSARDFKPGAVFTARMVEPVPLARSGQFVTVTLTTANVKVKTVARAMESGSYGQTIRVKNEATKEIYEVILTGPQTAEMNGGAMQESRDAKVASASE